MIECRSAKSIVFCSIERFSFRDPISLILAMSSHYWVSVILGHTKFVHTRHLYTLQRNTIQQCSVKSLSRFIW